MPTNPPSLPSRSRRARWLDWLIEERGGESKMTVGNDTYHIKVTRVRVEKSPNGAKEEQ